MTAAPVTPGEIRARLDEIRERLARVRADRWSHEFSDAGESIVITRAVIDSQGRHAGNEAPVALCSFGPDASWFEKEFVREARSDLAFVLDQLTAAGRLIREQRARLDRVAPPAGPARVKNLAAEASIKCGEPGFQAWLRLHHATDDDGDLADSATAAAVLRRALAIESRSQLNTDPDAAGRWREMRAEYSAWAQA
ncbi:hypothetical protein PZ897_02145 [Hoeflea sp. YIM 152468]|uniref:hypothetical protein n=1 Tax=Hoeflea sp. YIM 152468 TaxID=3031759 RepID=UPI0023DC10C3|nr:hypothetical protein [Hoeflea sp. YIM 152468]MDF1606972.1 hypothetical protein [Hoeflea sp. YIM 152468]